MLRNGGGGGSIYKKWFSNGKSFVEKKKFRGGSILWGDFYFLLVNFNDIVIFM